MDAKLMRNLDYWIGIPACFLLSGVRHIADTLSFKHKGKRKERSALFIKLSELGAIVLAYPLLANVKKEHPALELFFVTFKKNKDIFRLLGGIIPEKNILLISEKSFLRFALDSFNVLRRLRKEKIDIIFDLDFYTRFTAILSYLSKAKKRVGFHNYSYEGLYRGDLLTHKIQYNPLLHVSSNYFSLSRVIKSKSKDTPELEEKINTLDFAFPKYVPVKENRDKLKSKLEKAGAGSAKTLFLINPGDGVLPLREWPLNNFAGLAKMLLEDAGNYVLIIGMDGALKKAESILKIVNNNRCINLTGQTSLEELMELFNMADALISNDCGIAHLATLTPIKKFIIFGPESPQIFGSLGEDNRIIYSDLPCSPCLSVFNQRNSRCKNNVCLGVIESKYVYGLVSKALSDKIEEAVFKNK